jgi:hypothetical protein
MWLKMSLEAQGYQIQEIFLNKTMRVPSGWRIMEGYWLDQIYDQAFLDQGQHQRRRHHNLTLSNIGDIVDYL